MLKNLFLCLDASEDDDMPHSTNPEEALMTRLVRNYLKLDLSATQKICKQTIYKMNDSGMGKYFDGFIFLNVFLIQSISRILRLIFHYLIVLKINF